MTSTLRPPNLASLIQIFLIFESRWAKYESNSWKKKPKNPTKDGGLVDCFAFNRRGNSTARRTRIPGERIVERSSSFKGIRSEWEGKDVPGALAKVHYHRWIKEFNRSLGAPHFLVVNATECFVITKVGKNHLSSFSALKNTPPFCLDIKQGGMRRTGI